MKKSNKRICIPILFACLATFAIAFAASFTASNAGASSVELGASNALLNFTINNTNATVNITQVSITLPGNFSFIANSSNTSAANSIFSNNISTVLNWTNMSITNDTPTYFWFNVSVLSTASTGNYTFNITTLDTNGTTNTSNVNITVVAPDLQVLDIIWNTTAGNPGLPNTNDNITVWNVTINNTGDYNITSNFTVMIWLSLDGSTIASNSTPGNSSVPIGIAYNVSFNGSSGYTFTHLQNKIYQLYARVDSDNNVTESNESNDYFEYAVIGYNVTVLNITSSPGANQTVNASGNITVTVSVKYANSSNVTGLNQSNFMVWDKWTDGGFNPVDRTANTSFDVSANTFGIYKFNLTVPAVSADYTAQYGLHNITVQVTNGSYSGNATNGWYNLTAPKLTVTISHLSDIDLTEDTSDEFNLIIKNIGTAQASNVNFTLTTTKGSITPSTCRDDDIGTLLAGANDTRTCTITYEDTGTANVTAYVNGTYNGTVYRASDSDTAVIEQTTATTTTGTAGTAECTTNSDCSASYRCVSGVCTRLNCSTGETIVDHVCVNQYAVNITKWPTALNITQGAMKNETINVKNIGENALTNVKLSLSGVNWSDWYAVSPNNVSSLAQSGTTTFSINITVPSNATIASYTITANASSTNASDTQGFAVKVLPSEASKVAINATLKELEANITSVSTELNTLLAQLNTTNLTSANTTMNSVRTLLQAAKDAITAGDYFTAYQKMSQATDLLNTVKTIISTESTKPIIPWLWIEVGGGIAAAAVAVITLLSFVKTGGAKAATGAFSAMKALKPAKPSGFAYKPQTNRPGRAKEKIKEAFRKLREKMRRKPKEQMQLHQWTKKGWSPR